MTHSTQARVTRPTLVDVFVTGAELSVGGLEQTMMYLVSVHHHNHTISSHHHKPTKPPHIRHRNTTPQLPPPPQHHTTTTPTATPSPLHTSPSGVFGLTRAMSVTKGGTASNAKTVTWKERTKILSMRVFGKLLEWKWSCGWIALSEPKDLPEVTKHRRVTYLAHEDVVAEIQGVGATLSFLCALIATASRDFSSTETHQEGGGWHCGRVCHNPPPTKFGSSRRQTSPSARPSPRIWSLAG